MKNNEFVVNKKSIFYDEENKEYNRLWTYKKFFPFLNKEVENKIRDLGITKVVLFDKYGIDFSKWKSEKDLVLCVLPIFIGIDNSKNNTTTNYLKCNGFKNKKIYHSLSLNENLKDLINSLNETTHNYNFFIYFEERNIIVCKINLFAEKQFLDELLSKKDVFKFRSKEFIEDLRIDRIWKSELNNSIEACKNRIEAYKENVKYAKAMLIEKLDKMNREKLTFEGLKSVKCDFSKKFKKKIKEIKELTFISDFKVENGIKFTIKNVHINTNVMVGKETKNGFEVPLVRREKVFIGDLVFNIINGDISVFSDGSIDGCEHPHSEEGNMCFGEDTDKVLKWIREFEFKKVAVYLYSWSTTYNCDDCFKKIEDFYRTQKERRKRCGYND